MSTRKLVITAVLAGSSQSEAARRYGVSQGWVSRLMARYAAEGDAAFETRSRRPHTTPSATPPAVVDEILRLRKRLTEQGLDAGADTIVWHLTHHHDTTVSRATVHRILTREGAITPEPRKRPRSSCIRFQADQPNETWQSDFTHYRLTNPGGTPGTDAEIITWLDDHSRYVLHASAHQRVTAPVVLHTFRKACEQHGYPASVLTDNGMVYTVRYAGGRGGRNHLQHELRRLNIVQKNGRPNHPTTQGKVERFQQTMKKWLRAQPIQPTTTTAYQARPKATPNADRTIDTHDRVRHDRVSTAGTITLRYNGTLYRIGKDLDIRIINAATGETLRDLTLDPTRIYQGTGRPPGPTRK